jgi:uncharacterized protein
VTSCDTNVLFMTVNADAPGHAAAVAFIAQHRTDQRFLLCEQVLAELYCLLRNPAVTPRPLDAAEAVAVIQRFRANPAWRIVDVPGEARIMDSVWRDAGQHRVAFRRVFDLRLAATLRHHGVVFFATRNTRDFTGLGFERVWDPTA